MKRLSGAAGTALFLCVLSLAGAPAASAADWYVSAGAGGSGTAASPFGRIQDGLAAARPGDTVHVVPGTYTETLKTVRHGTSAARIVLRAAGGRGSVIVTKAGRVLTVSHEYFTVEGLVLDGQYGADDIIRVNTAAHNFTLRDSEVRRASKDGIDIIGPRDVLIEGSLVHHTLNAANGRADAHGIVAGPVRRLTIRDTEIHTFSGDAVQVDPGRDAPGWSDVLIEGCRFWLAPLPSAENGFPKGTVPGENALDTKADMGLPRAKITVRDTIAYGFRGGLISNMAAFNLKEHIDATIDRVTVYDSEIAFRLRGAGSKSTGAEVLVTNTLVYNSGKAFRYEDNVRNLRIWNTTVGGGVTTVFHEASSDNSTLDVRNLLVLGTKKPAEAAGSSNLAAPASAFVNAGSHNYQLAEGTAAIDSGEAIDGVTEDRQGTARPQGAGYDIGAFERVGATAPPPPGGGSPGGGDGAGDIVLHAWKAAVIVGDWTVEQDATAAGGARLASVDRGAPAAGKTQAKNPLDYVELTFDAEAGRPYRLWIRGQAENDDLANDSVYVQFSGSVTARGAGMARIGSKDVLTVTLQGCSKAKCQPQGWGWRDNVKDGDPAELVYFAKSGPQTIRIQPREDGLSIDQIVLSPATYLGAPPGAPRGDATILPESR